MSAVPAKYQNIWEHLCTYNTPMHDIVKPRCTFYDKYMIFVFIKEDQTLHMRYDGSFHFEFTFNNQLLHPRVHMRDLHTLTIFNLFKTF